MTYTTKKWLENTKKRSRPLYIHEDLDATLVDLAEAKNISVNEQINYMLMLCINDHEKEWFE